MMAAPRALLFMLASLCPCLGLAAELFDTTRLVQIATRHQLPMPPKNAPVVLAHTHSWQPVGHPATGSVRAIYSPAFLLEKKVDGSIVILRGAEQVTLERRRNGETLWRAFSAEPVQPDVAGYSIDYGRLSAFVCAVQLAARGEENNAQIVWRRFSAAEWWSDGEVSDDVRNARKAPPILLGRCIFDHLRKTILQKPGELVQVHGQMKALFDEFPALKSSERAELFNDVGATVIAPPPPANSTEALLLDWAGKPNRMRHLGIFNELNTGPDASARAIVLRGFESIPGLIALLDDRRITAHEQPAVMRASARILRIGDLAKGLLEDLTGFKSSNASDAPTPAALRAWWEREKNRDEADFFARAVFRQHGGKIVWVEEYPERVLAHKFPAKLPPLFEQFARDAQPATQPFSLAEALAVSDLP
jgi:hypothetical protein